MLEDPRLVEERSFPKAGTVQEKLIYLLNYALLAPSGHNTQPWLFSVTEDAVLLYADRTKALAVVDPGDRELIMSCGASLFHLTTAMRHFYMVPEVTCFPDPADPDLLASVRIGTGKAGDVEEAHTLFKAMKRRRTNRQPFKSRPVPHIDLAALENAANTAHATLHFFADAREKSKLGDLIADGDRLQGADKHFRRELAAWIHPSRKRKKDGLPGYALGVNELQSIAMPLLVRTFDWGNGQAAKDKQLADGSPVLAILATQEDTPKAWLDAGQALAYVLLLATHFGISVSYLNQPLERPTLRPKVAETMKISGYPQLILRMGYGPQQTPATPRKPLREVMLP